VQNNQKIKIKKSKLSDLDSFLDLFRVSVRTQFPGYSQKTKKYFLGKMFTRKNFILEIKQKKADLLLAAVGEKIVGFLLAYLPYGGISYISWLAVKESFQGKGAGTALLKEYEVIAKEKGIHKIHLWTDKRNLKFYKRNGWTLVGMIPENYFGADDWLFYKTIQKPNY